MIDLLVWFLRWAQRPRRPRCYEIPVRAVTWHWRLPR